MAKRTKAKRRTDGLTLTFTSCEVTSFVAVPRKKKPKAMTFRFGTQFGHRSDGNKVMLVVMIEGFPSKLIDPPPDFESLPEPKGRPALRIQTECIYSVHGFEALERGRDGGLIFPKSLVTTVINCSFGVTRGLMIARTEDTPYRGVIPPIMSINRFLPEEFAMETDHGM